MKTRKTGPAGVRTITASEFKARCIELMDEVADSGVEIVITKYGRPVSRLVPCRKKPDTLFGIDREKLEILGDIDGPLDVAWEAETGTGASDRPKPDTLFGIDRGKLEILGDIDGPLNVAWEAETGTGASD